MKTAILGGSFNPPHLGHLALAESVRDIGYRRIIFVPAHRPPHKVMAVGAGDENRVAMLELALDGLGWAEIWNGELLRGGKSYSIDTVRELKASNEVNGRPGLVIGEDLLSGFFTWHEADSLAREAQIIVARRVHPPFEISREIPDGFILLDNDLVDCSSTEIRDLVREGRDIRSLVPKAVADYIEDQRLYVRS